MSDFVVPVDPKVDEWTFSELLEIAKWQKQVMWCLVVEVLSFIGYVVLACSMEQSRAAGLDPALIMQFVLVAACLIAGLLNLIAIYRLAKSLRLAAFLYPFATFLGVIGLIVFLYLANKATETLKKHGLKVGVMGVDQAEFDRIRTQAQENPVLAQ